MLPPWRDKRRTIGKPLPAVKAQSAPPRRFSGAGAFRGPAGRPGREKINLWRLFSSCASTSGSCCNRVTLGKEVVQLCPILVVTARWLIPSRSRGRVWVFRAAVYERARQTPSANRRSGPPAPHAGGPFSLRAEKGKIAIRGLRLITRGRRRRTRRKCPRFHRPGGWRGCG